MKLFEPGTIGKLSIKNRIVMPAMNVGPLGEPDGRISQRLIDFYVERARGGTGLVITTSIRASRELETLPNPRSFWSPLADDTMYINRFSELAEGAHDHGARIAVQLSIALGRNAPPGVTKIVGAVGPSANPTFFDRSVVSRELTTKEVERIPQQVGFAANIIKSSGIDAVEMNFHGGYLFDEFTSALWNRRTDKYGGSLDNRMRLSIEVVEAIKKSAGADFPVIVKYGLTHYIPGGREIEEGLEMAKRWEAAGVDALDIDAGVYEVKYWLNPPTTQPMGCMVDLAAMVKQVVKIPVITVGKLGVPGVAERVLTEGKADFIGLGRPLLADPQWGNKVKEGRFEDICPCLGDHEGCHQRLHDRKYISCTVNPAAGMERDLAIGRADKKKSVLVVGGGPGGMEAARVSAIRGHKVVMWEKGYALGGNLIAASAPDFKQEYRALITYLSTQIQKLGVETRLGKEATPDLIRGVKPDVVFVATGATPIMPEFPGRESNNVVTAVDVLLGKQKTGKRVVVVGGGTAGCETALYLAQKGSQVSIVEIMDAALRDVYWINQMHFVKLLQDNEVKILVGTRVLEITGKGVAVAGKDGRKSTLAADSVVIAVGLKANDALLESVREQVPEIHAIGDCVQPRKVIDAIWEAYRVARLI